jgi:hypothetical protein
MTEWLQQNGCEVQVPRLSDMQLCLFAQSLHDSYDTAIQFRDFEPLRADKENFPLDLLKVIEFVAERPELHDKFWRYLTLFSKAVSMSDV